MIKNYIFDFDGTVADTIKGIVATMQETFRLHDREIPTLLTAQPHFIVDSFNEILACKTDC